MDYTLEQYLRNAIEMAGQRVATHLEICGVAVTTNDVAEHSGALDCYPSSVELAEQRLRDDKYVDGVRFIHSCGGRDLWNFSLQRMDDTCVLAQAYVESNTEDSAKVAKQRDDLAMMTKRLVRALNIIDPTNTVAKSALGYLHREQLMGSILRDG